LLPAQFKELEEFDSWILKSDAERIDRRLTMSQPELVSFYNGMLPHIGKIMAYLRERPIGAVSPEDDSLLKLMYSLADVSVAVEVYEGGAVTGGADLRHFIPNFVSWMQ
jgi:hypothetical protein